MTLSIPQEQNTINMKKGILVNQDSEYSERELQTDQEDETNPIVFNDNESPQHEPIQVIYYIINVCVSMCFCVQ